MTRRRLPPLPFLLLASCAAFGSSREPSPWADAAGAVRHPDLAAIATDLWEEILRADPVQASFLGDRRYLDLLPDASRGAREDRRERLLALGRRLDDLDAAALEADERVTLAVARHYIRAALARADARFEEWIVSPRGAPHVFFFNLAPDQPAATPQERGALLRRWRRMRGFVHTARANLLRGLSDGRVANRTSVERTLEQLDRILAQDVGEWPLAHPVLPDDFAGEDRERLLAEVREILEDDLRPALGRYRDALREEILPASRPDRRPGLCGLPGGVATYERLVAAETSLPFTPRELHAVGRQEVARIRDEMTALGRRLFQTRDFPSLQARLRGDPALHFSDRDEVEAKAREALDRAREAMGRAFGLQPAAPCVVVRIGPHEERETTIAYYREPSSDRKTPGRYFVNTFAPETRPRFQAEALAFHEAIPGHHLQIAIAQEREGIPRFQREVGSTAFVEGWALYAERLSEELGLYTSDLDRLGRLSFEAWRAARLVVDTGLHAFEWSREDAIDYLLANTLLERINVENEIDRYITSPAQALAYKTGEREMLALRDRAISQRGEAFDLKAFHDVVLGAGAVPLGVLRERVAAWMAGAPAASDD